MTLLIVLASVVAYLTGYLTIGWRLARCNLPTMWEKARKQWISEEYIAESVRAQLFGMTLFWPFVLPVQFVIRRLDHAASAGDPKTLRRELDTRERKVRDRERAIAALERELGIGQR